MAVLLAPGEGRYSEPAPTSEFSKFPMHMVHPGFSPGTVGEEIKSPHGFSYHVGGTAIRFPPVLVWTEDQEQQHAAQGYVSIGKSDPAAFARAVAEARPIEPDHKPEPYPKWVGGKVANNAEEEARILGVPVASSEPAEAAPSIDTEVNTLEVWPKQAPGLGGGASAEDEIAALEARLAALRASRAEPIVTLNEDAITEPLVMKEPQAESHGVPPLMASDRPRELTHGERIRLGKERAALRRLEAKTP